MRLLSVLLALIAPLAAAQGVASAPEVRFERLALGLPHPEVQALAQDHDGLLWIGTADGLARYDGLGLTVLRHRPDDPTSLPSSRVQALLVGADGTLWVGTRAGLARLDVATDRFGEVAPSGNGACAGAVAWLAEDAEHRILFGARAQGVCRLDPRTRRVEPVPLPWATATPPRDRAWGFQGLPNGAVWVLGADPGTACRIDPTGGPCRDVGLRGFQPRQLGLDADGRLLAVGTAREGGASELRRWSRGQFLPVAQGLPDYGRSEAASIAGVGREAWVTTATGGVLAVGLESGTWRWLAPVPGDPTSLPAHRVGAILVDRQAGAWVGTSSGVAVWRPPLRPFTLYRRYSGRPGEISDDRVNGMSEDRTGALWVATNDGLNRLDPASDRFETFRVSSSQSEGPPAWAPAPSDPYRDAWWQVQESDDGTLWVGGKRNGLFRMDPRTGLFLREAAASRALGLVTQEGAPRGFGVRHIYEDASNRLWLGTTGEGLAVRNPETGNWEAVRPVAGDSTLPHPSVNRFFEDSAGRFWVGTDAGVARARHPESAAGMTFDPLDLGEPVPVWSMAESSATPGVLWVGTVGSGLARVDIASGEVRWYTTDDGLPSDMIYGVLSDDRGHVWASTSQGLVRLDPSTETLAVYDEAHGLQENAFDLMAFYRSATTGRLWFGGPNGLSRIDPEGVGVTTYRPPVAFTSVHVFDAIQRGRPLAGDTLRFRHDQNFLTVQFAALDFTAPRSLKYEYRLVGVDDAWRQTTGQRPFATYTALAPGTYRLEVIGFNADGEPNPEPAVLVLVIEPAWWQRGPVQMIGWVLLALLAAAGILALLHRAARIYVEERRAVADDLHAGPILGIGMLNDDLAQLGGDGAAEERIVRLRSRVGEVESGLHEALLRLQPAAVARLGLARALDVTVRRFRRAAPHVAIRTDWTGLGAILPDALQQDAVEILTVLVGHTLRVTDQGELFLSAASTGDALELRVASDGEVPLTQPALRDRLRGRQSGLARALRVVRARGGALDVDREDGRSAVVARLPIPDAVAA